MRKLILKVIFILDQGQSLAAHKKRNIGWVTDDSFVGQKGWRTQMINNYFEFLGELSESIRISIEWNWTSQTYSSTIILGFLKQAPWRHGILRLVWKCAKAEEPWPQLHWIHLSLGLYTYKETGVKIFNIFP